MQDRARSEGFLIRDQQFKGTLTSAEIQIKGRAGEGGDRLRPPRTEKETSRRVLYSLLVQMYECSENEI